MVFKKNLRKILFITILFYCNFELYSQVSQSIPIDILSGLNDGKIQASIEPSLTINTVGNIFDGNPLKPALCRIVPAALHCNLMRK